MSAPDRHKNRAQRRNFRCALRLLVAVGQNAPNVVFYFMTIFFDTVVPLS